MKRAQHLSFIAAIALVLARPTLAQKSNAPTGKQLAQDYSFTVKSSPPWSDTGLQLEPGDRVHIQGVSAACEGVMPHEKAHLLLPSAPGGALLAKSRRSSLLPMQTCPSSSPVISI